MTKEEMIKKMAGVVAFWWVNNAKKRNYEELATMLVDSGIRPKEGFEVNVTNRSSMSEQRRFIMQLGLKIEPIQYGRDDEKET